jgi:hypothetical protein
MIRDEDVQFHAADPRESTWAETNFFGFYSAEAHLNVGVYALFRTNLGIVSSTICMNSGFARAPWEADFCDLRASLPIPEPRDLSNFRLDNTLSIRCMKPNMDWWIGYDDGAGTTIDVTYRSIMPPFDIHDPDLDPMKAKALKAASEGGGQFAWGTAYNGHFDQTGHFLGVVKVRGKAYPIDCVSTMDHSWGPRPERGAPNMSWLHAHFSRDLAMHAIFSFDPEANGTLLSLAHGYVVEHGKIFGVKDAHGRTKRRERYAETVDLVLIDNTDREWKLSAEGLTTFPWQCWPNMVSFNVLGRWRCGDRVGYGEIQDFFEMPQLTALNATAATRAPVAA